MNEAMLREHLIAKYLDGRASQEEVDQLGDRLKSSPEAVLAFVRQAWMETCLEKQFEGTVPEAAIQSPLRLRPSGRRQVVSHSGRRWLPYGMAAVVLISASAMFSFIKREPAEPQPVEVARVSSLNLAPGGAPARIETAAGGKAVQNGSIILAGDRLVTAAHEVQLTFTGETTALRCDPGSVVAFRQQSEGTRIVLDSGVVHASVAKQHPGQQLRFVTPFGDALVVGTRLTIEVRSDATRVQVLEGEVRLRRPSTAEEVTITAGYEAVSSAHGVLDQAAPILPERRELPLVWSLASGTTKYFLSSTAAWRELRDPDGTSYGRFTARTSPAAGAIMDQREFAWITLDREAQDWSSGDGLLLRVRGAGDGRPWVCEIYDDLPVERFVQEFKDDVSGWREVFLPFSGFTRRAEPMQHAQAPRDGLGLVRMHGVGLIAPAGDASLDVARVAVVPLR